MNLDLQRFYQSCDPSHTLILENPEERKYYIDFASVRGGKVIEALARTITRLSPDKPTCQLFTGHIGCGKSGSSVLVMPNYQFRVPPTHAYAILTPLQAAIA